jgi:uncharacterized protein YdaU (DUF1376 family)
MGKHDVTSFDDESKPTKTKRVKGDRYAFHQCFHGDAWQGILHLSPAETNVYWRIILLMYMSRAALSDDDAHMARLCNESLKNYRRAKAGLIAKGRIIQDEDMGLLFDERAIRELVAADRFSQEQTERVMRRWEAKKNAPKRGGKPRVVVDNSTPKHAEVGVNSRSTTPPTLAQIEENQTLSGYRSDTNHIQNHKETEIEAQTSAPRTATPPLRGSGAPTEPKKQRHAEALQALHRAFGSSGRPEVAEEGFEETEPIGAKHGAQTCRRSS